MGAIASGHVTVSSACANAGSDAAARVMNEKLKHCESRMTCSHLPHSHMYQCWLLVIHHYRFASLLPWPILSSKRDLPNRAQRHFPDRLLISPSLSSMRPRNGSE